MRASYMFAICSVNILYGPFIMCNDEEYLSYWANFKRSVSHPKLFEDRGRRESGRRERPWGFPRFHGHPHSFEDNDMTKDTSRFPGHHSGEDDWNFRSDDALMFNEGNVDERARGDRGPVLFPVVSTSSTERPSRRLPTRQSRFPTPPRRPPTSPRQHPNPARWPPVYPERPMNYPTQPPTISSVWESTPNSISVSTPAVPGMQTRRPPCEEACRTTPEYNPICGTDNVTYDNMGRFDCALKCGKNIRIDFRGACPVPVRGR